MCYDRCMPGAKTKRNEKIKALFANNVGQAEIARRFRITQGRVSAIVTGRFPKYRYCRRCGDRLVGTAANCAPCREKRAEELRLQKEATRKRKEQMREERKLARTCPECDGKKIFANTMCHQCYRVRHPRSYTYKQTCGLCKKETKSSWKICLSCAPYREKLSRNGFKGRERVRSLVRARDEYTCQDCGFRRTAEEVQKFNSKMKGNKGKIKSLDVHHMEGMCGKNSRGYDKVEDMPILITLCHQCHYHRHDHSMRGRRVSS